MDLEKGLMLINLPRKIGSHPEDGNQIITALGRFGPYIKHNTTYVSLKDPDEMFTVGMNDAVSPQKSPKAPPRKSAKPQRKRKNLRPRKRQRLRRNPLQRRNLLRKRKQPLNLRLRALTPSRP